MVVKRGEIWWATLDQPGGLEPDYRQPVAISSNKLNQSKINTAIIVVIAQNLRLAEVLDNFSISKKSPVLLKILS